MRAAFADSLDSSIIPLHSIKQNILLIERISEAEKLNYINLSSTSATTAQNIFEWAAFISSTAHSLWVERLHHSDSESAERAVTPGQEPTAAGLRGGRHLIRHNEQSIKCKSIICQAFLFSALNNIFPPLNTKHKHYGLIILCRKILSPQFI